jgi:hypothetical protein
VKALAGQLRKAHHFEPLPWVGLHTGPAIVEVKDDALSVVGDARNVAVRLEEEAAPGQVICTEATHRLFQGQFQCASLGPRKIKGVAQPVQLFHVERIAAGGNSIEAVATAELSPLTGRDNEISLLKDRWEQAQEGMGQVVLLIGEPGLGKSRLVHTLKQHVLGQMVEGDVDAPVIEWRCSPHFQNTGLYPAIDFYERALTFDREEPPEDRFERMLHRLEQYDLVRPETVQLWASLLSLPTPDRFPPLSLSPVQQRQETFRALLEWLHTLAARKPILFVVEDLHWVDASTLEFLGQFLAEGLHNSILTLFTFRPEFKTPWPAVAHQTSLALNRLTRRQVGELMRKKTESDLPESLVDQFYERTGGVPLFVEEFTKMVKDSGEVSASGQTLLGREIPATLQDLMMVRLDRMEGERELAQLAATLGREFSHELLAAIAALDEPTLEGELAKLVQAEILYPKGRPPRCSYIFKHALLEDALYNAVRSYWRLEFVVVNYSRSSSFYIKSLPGCIDLTTRPHTYPEGWYLESSRRTGPSVDWVDDYGQMYRGRLIQVMRYKRFTEVFVPYWIIVTPFAAFSIAAWLPWRFSLRTLLIATTLVAVALGRSFGCGSPRHNIPTAFKAQESRDGCRRLLISPV